MTLLEKIQPSPCVASGAMLAHEVTATPLPQLHWVARSHTLAQALGLRPEQLADDDTLQLLGGNRPPRHGSSVATVYSGHQFGHWAGQLGDGRALLLGELNTPQGPMEVQLKGAGRTPYSRMGDGRAVLRSSIREFLASEAMHGLGIPTTRALALVGSPQPVQRETTETAAVVTRVAPSFLRFGHVEHHSYNRQHDVLQRLADHVIDHHYPECREASHPLNRGGRMQPYAALLASVAQATAELMAQWQAVGFCHGVMNTDNMSLLGLTLDYGPFQFMDGFDPNHICNHTDTGGRYAYSNQPEVARWNLFALAQALLPLIGEPDNALAALEPYPGQFEQAYNARMAAKLGLGPAECTASTPELVAHTLSLLAAERVDYTLFWRLLAEWVRAGEPMPRSGEPDHPAPDSAPAMTGLANLFQNQPKLVAYLNQYQEQTKHGNHAEKSLLMLKTSPKFVLRNHLAQTAIEQAQAGSYTMVNDLLAVLQTPFDEHPAHTAWAGLPPDWAANIHISCSS